MIWLKLIYTSSAGRIIELYGAPYRLYAFEGLGDVEAEIQTQRSPYQDGSAFIDAILGERHIQLELKIVAKTEQELSKLKRYLSSIFNPKTGLGLLQAYTADGIKEIHAIAESIPYFPDGAANRGKLFQKAMINLIAPNPYWRDPNQTAKALQSYVGNFTLPFTLPFELGVSGSRTTLFNEGDVPAPVTIDIHGPTTNPQVINRTTGDYIRINRTIANDEILHINTASGQQRVEIYRGNTIEQGFGYLDHNSELFTLEIGENEIEHIADAGNADAIVAVSWQSRYGGI